MKKEFSFMSSSFQFLAPFPGGNCLTPRLAATKKKRSFSVDSSSRRERLEIPCRETDERRPSCPVRRVGISQPYYHYAFAMLFGSTPFVTFSHNYVVLSIFQNESFYFKDQKKNRLWLGRSKAKNKKWEQGGLQC